MPRRKPELSLLDRYVLSLVRQGLGTVYELQKVGGISIGAAFPALRRLEQNGLVYVYAEKRKKGERKKREYQPALAGIHPLEAAGPDNFADRNLPVDIESVARIVALGGEGVSKSIVLPTLEKAITYRQRKLGRPVRQSSESPVADRYRSIMNTCESGRLRAEISVLKKVRSSLK